MYRRLAIAAATSFVAAAVTAHHTTSRDDIVETAISNGNFDTLVSAVQAAELVETLQGDGPFTVFAPTDAAFAKVDQQALANTLKPENQSRLQDILTYHVVPGRITADQLVNTRYVTTVNGKRLEVDTSNGVKINNANIIATNVETSNGIIHVIDTVLVPAKKTLAETAVSAGSFETLVAAAQAAGLVDALATSGPFTVFAPTDDAFATLPAGTVESLLQPENRDQLTKILSYHVVPGIAYANNLLTTPTLTTLAGEELDVATEDGSLTINGIRVVSADLEASNGVIHVIADGVLLPETTNSSADASSVMQASDVQAFLQLAIDRGVPLFNDGQPESCAAIYEVAITGALMMDLPTAARDSLRDALDRGRRTHDQSDRAWAFRRGIDAAFTSLSRQMSSTH